jgi:hypothetical protein
LKEYHSKRDELSLLYKIPSSKLGNGLSSLLAKRILFKNNRAVYSIHYRLIPYMHKKSNLEYGFAVKCVAYDREQYGYRIMN